RVEVVLPGEHAGTDLAAQSEAHADGQLDRLLVEHGKGARQAERGGVDVRVRLAAELVGRAREELGPRRQLGVDLEPYDDLPAVGSIRRRFAGVGFDGGHGAASSRTAAERSRVASESAG